MCEIKTVLIVAAILSVATSFCIYQVKAENKVGHHSEIKSENPCKKVHKEYCLNGGECYCLDNEEYVGCNCTWVSGGERCEKYMWWT